MDAAKRARLEARGFKVGTVQEFLGLTDAQDRAIEAHMRLLNALKSTRLKLGLTQVQAAEKLGVAQPRLAKMESGDPQVSMDALIRALLGYGLSLRDLGQTLAQEQPAIVEPLQEPVREVIRETVRTAVREAIQEAVREKVGFTGPPA